MNTNGEHKELPNGHTTYLLDLSPQEIHLIYGGYVQDSARIINAIGGTGEVNKDILRLWRDCFIGAVKIHSTKKEIVFDNDKRFFGEKLARRIILREILFGSIKKMETYPNIVPEGKIQESLGYFLDFLEKGEYEPEPEKRLALFRYLAHVSVSLTEKMTGNQIKNTSS